MNRRYRILLIENNLPTCAQVRRLQQKQLRCIVVRMRSVVRERAHIRSERNSRLRAPCTHNTQLKRDTHDVFIIRFSLIDFTVSDFRYFPFMPSLWKLLETQIKMRTTNNSTSLWPKPFVLFECCTKISK